MPDTTITLRQFLEEILAANDKTPTDVRVMRVVGPGPTSIPPSFMTASWEEFCQPAHLINLRCHGPNSASLCVDHPDQGLYHFLCHLVVVGDDWFLRVPSDTFPGRLSFQLITIPPRTGLPILADFLNRLIPEIRVEQLYTHDAKVAKDQD